MFKLFPESIVVLLPAFSLLIIGYVVEKHYVSRVTCFTSSLALVVHYVTVYDPGWVLRIHANIGLFLGLIGFNAYIQENSMPMWFYDVTHAAYSSMVVGTILIYPLLHSILSNMFAFNPSILLAPVAAIVIILNFLLMNSPDGIYYTGARRFEVNRFIANSRIEVPNKRGTSMVSLTHWFDLE